MGIWQRAKENVSDVRTLGPRFLLRHIGRRWSGATSTAVIRGEGTVRLRRGTSDLMVFRQVFSERQYSFAGLPQEKAIQNHYERTLTNGRTPLIIDAGANNGASAMWFAKQYPRARVIAIEPEPGNAEMCRANTGRYAVDVRVAALGGTSGTVNVRVSDRSSWAVSTVREHDGSTEVTTIPDLYDRSDSSLDLFIVKIDIEGFESDVFSANTGWVPDAKVIVIEPHDWLYPDRATSRNFQAVMGAHDFDVLILGENLVYVRREETGADLAPGSDH